MSRIYFHSPSAEAEIRGSERAWMGCVTTDVGIAPLKPLRDIRAKIRASYEPRDEQGYETLLRVGNASFVVGDQVVSAWETLLNTCLAIGNDALCLMARLHAQCEIHAWVRGSDRAWIAGVIEEGLRAGLMRQGQGWPELVEFLRSRDDEPVVTSYSVCDRFPNRHAAGWTPPTDEDGEPNTDAWYDLPADERWRLAMPGIEDMRFDASSLRRPFGHKKTAFDVLASR